MSEHSLGWTLRELTVPKWQPIETAPKDGTPILLWGKVYAEVGSGSRDVPIAIQASWEDGWRVAATTYYSLDVEPTYWMPINAPPA